jgi:ribosomal protein S6--L-glutamate ligase
MKKFKYFLEYKNKIDTVIVITEPNFELNSDGKHYTVNRIEEECKNKKIKCHVIFINNFFIDEYKDDIINMKIYDNEGNEKKIKINTRNAIAIIRGDIFNTTYGSGLCEFIKLNNIPLYNEPEIIKLCGNKYITYINLKKYNINMPKTNIITNEHSISDVIESIGGKFPVIVKTLTGAQGIGITKADSIDSLKAMLQAFWKLKAELLIQEYIENDYDVRVIVINGKIIAAMKRNVPKDDFRSNKSIGGKTEPYTLNEKEIEFINKISKIISGNFIGIDFVKKGDKNYLIEVNSSPGSDGIEKTSKKNIIKILLDNLT